MTHLRRV